MFLIKCTKNFWTHLNSERFRQSYSLSLKDSASLPATTVIYGTPFPDKLMKAPKYLRPSCAHQLCSANLAQLTVRWEIALDERYVAQCVNVSCVSRKLLRTQPHIVMSQGITMAPLFLRFTSWKLIHNQFKSLSNLTFSQMFWLFLLFWFTLKLSWECSESSRKEVLFWFWHGKKCEF